MLFNGRAITTHQEVTSGGRAERFAASTGPRVLQRTDVRVNKKGRGEKETLTLSSIRSSPTARPSEDYPQLSLCNDQEPSAGGTPHFPLSTPFSSSRETAFERCATVVDSNCV